MSNLQSKNASKIALTVLFVLLVGSIVFYKERMLFIDASWVSFLIINTKHLFIQEHRFGSFITQMFPLIGTWLKLPIQTILLLYSLSFSLFYFIAAFILHKIKQYDLVLIIAFYFTLCVSSSYFWTNNEVHQGVVWLMLLLGFLFRNESSKSPLFIRYSIFFALACLAISSHPLILFATVYLWGFYFLEQKELLFKQKRIISYSILLLIIMIVKFYLSKNGWYDGGKIDQLTAINTQKLWSSLQSNTANHFLSNLLSKYWQFLLISISGLGYLIFQKRFLILSWTLLSALAYFVSICVTYPDCAFEFYIESEWMVISIILCFPFIRGLLPNIKWAVGIVSAIFIFRLIFIFEAASIFEKRFTLLTQIVNEQHSRKSCKTILLCDEKEMNSNLMMTWGLPIETLLLSNINDKNHPVSVIKLTTDEMNTRLKEINRFDFLGPFYTIRYNEIDKEYFKLDTTNAYTIDTCKYLKN